MRAASFELRAQVSLRDELRSAVSIFRVGAVSDFLLGTDARVDAAVVTAAGPQSRSVAVRLDSLSTSMAAATFDDDFNFRVVTDWLFLPAVERATYSLGIHLSKEDRQTTRVGLLRPGFASTRYLRYLRDHAAGVHVSVGHYDDGTELLHLRGLNQTLRHRSGKVFRFRTDSFLAVMAAAAASGAPPDVDALLECLTLVYSFEEDRFCPVCAAPPDTPCDCARDPAARAKAVSALPRDVCPLKRSLHNNRGEYAGRADIELLSGGMSYRSMHSRRHTTLDLSEHHALETQLINWAVRDRLSALSPKLTKLVMPPNGRRRPELLSIGPAQNVSSALSTLSIGPGEGGGSAAAAATAATAAVEAAPRPLPPPQFLDVPAGALDCALAPGSADEKAPPSVESVRHFFQTFSPGPDAADVVMGDALPGDPAHFPPRRPRAPQIETQGLHNAVSPVTPVPPPCGGRGGGGGHSPLLSLPSSGSGAGSARSGSGSPRGGPAPSASPPPRPPPPAGAAAAADVDGSGSSGAEDIPETIVRGLQVIKEHGGSGHISREELRRIVPMRARDIAKTFRRARNREAAARSNLKRKHKLQALRTDLADVRRRKKECVDRHAALARENERLKAAVRRAGRGR